MKEVKLNSRNIRDAISRLEKMELSKISKEDLRKVLDRLMSGYKVEAPRYEAGLDIFRARICEKPGTIGECSYPPAQYVKERGRANDVNQSMFYGSNYRGVPLFELRCEPGDKIALSHWRTTAPLVLNHIGFTEETEERLGSNRSLPAIYDFVKKTNNFNDLNEMVHEYLGFMFSKPLDGEEDQAYYKLTSTISDMMMQSEHINGLMFPTNQMFGNAENIILKPEYVEQSMDFISVEYIEVISKEGATYEINSIDSATREDAGVLQWSGRPLQWTIEKPGALYKFEYQASGIWVAKDLEGNILNPS
ncbi:hypothetical protein [Vibrio sp. S12_S33]|uniref:hypothetical protein n=1 Tax=Vibrio sp. S12_S33 TaxID=2720223 RepID=UPI00177CCA72|nr:hypothetical protein [Vibrio sp. S12_S33]MBD1567611.1 hypothetical protein [Vibrio sp. S12_S33]